MALPITKLTSLRIPLEDVREATNNFDEDNLISTGGGFGPAYKGQLLHSGKWINIAARRLDRSYGLGEVEFLTEVSVLSDLKHPNLVSLIGFCDEKGDKIIITSYEANGSLSQFLNSSNLTWTQRLRICLGVACALNYLHSDEERDYAVVHRNINSNTILLDENWEPKLSGFEISIKQSVNRMDRVVLCEPIDIEGYMDPAIEKMGGVTYKSDVYSFGIVLFEMLCGRLSFVPNEGNRFLAPLAKYHYENSTMEDIMHPDLWNQMSPRSLLRYSSVAYSCIEEEPGHRREMGYTVDELKKALEIQLQREHIEKNLEHLKVPLADIKFATENFSNKYKIRSTKYYTLYRAELQHIDKGNPSSVEGRNKDDPPQMHNSVVIKRICPRDDEYGEEAFYTEVNMLSSAKHRNVVTLLGFSVEDSEMINVIENLSNGYLACYFENVDTMRILTWKKRLKVCIGVAQALNYLHYEMEDQKRIISRGINIDNIALDENWDGKIVDFGLSVYLPLNQEDGVLHLDYNVGKIHHRAPEYDMYGMLRIETDVYSFGVVMFEILCGRFANDPIYLDETDKGLVFMARRCFEMGTLEEMIDPFIKEETGENSLILNRGPIGDSFGKFVEIAYHCVAKNLDTRPTTEVIVKELKRALCLLEEEEFQRRDVDQGLDEKTKGPGPQWRSYISKQSQCQGRDQLVDELEESSELELTHEILVKNLEHLKIPLNDIKVATGYFSNKHEIAGTKLAASYDLYRAKFHHFDKENPSIVVIKRFEADLLDYFPFKELQILTSVKHDSIVNLVGFCFEGSERIIVVENFNGFLADYLGDVKKRCDLTWERRLNICIDVAEALNYLESKMLDKNMIVYYDIRSEYIALDENFRAKIVDFGRSLYFASDLEIYTTSDEEDNNEHGTYVYRFGVVLFEILCTRAASEENFEELESMARRCFDTGTLEDMIDPIIREEIGENTSIVTRGPNKDSLNTFIQIAYKCVAETKEERPTMNVVLTELEKALIFQRNNKDSLVITLEDIKLATRNFHDDNYIGGGGFGKVYLGKLQDGDGSNTVVVKRLYGEGKQHFLTELHILLEYKHDNVIGLVGYCDENDEKIIVYEYASRSSLDRYLNHASLTWLKRLNICIEIASALDFLHGGAGKQAKVVHRDIKTANILLNLDWKAKLADFGLSLMSGITKETDYVIDHACGTPGYVDPLYAKSKILTVESDVYSFGVVLFEILCGRSTFAFYKQEGHELPHFVKERFGEGKHDEVVFEQIRDQIVPKSLTTFKEIAYQCLHHEREKRPTTKEVLRELQRALEYQISKGDVNSTTPSNLYQVQDESQPGNLYQVAD